MKLLLRRDLQGVGRAGDIVDVNDAYARNFVVPRGFGVIATPQVVQSYTKEQSRRKEQLLRHEQAMQTLSEQLQGSTLRITGRANPQGKLFAALRTEDVRTAIEQQYALSVPQLRCVPDHFKTVGDHAVQVHLDQQHVIQLTLRIDHVD